MSSNSGAVTRIKQMLPRFVYFLVAGLLLWVVMGAVIGWFVEVPGSQRQPHEGKPCGPGYRWTRVGPAIDPDLSCEKE